MTKKLAELSADQKADVATIFQPLLSDVFGGEKYKKYWVPDMIQTTKTYVKSELVKRKGIDSKVLGVTHDALAKIARAKTAERILTIISDMALIDQEL